jgi:hypothetical protein
MLINVTNPETLKREIMFVVDLKEAQEKVRKITNEIGSRDWYQSMGTGNVVDSLGNFIAHISYNGRIWEVDNNGNLLEPKQEILL